MELLLGSADRMQRAADATLQRLLAHATLRHATQSRAAIIESYCHDLPAAGESHIADGASQSGTASLSQARLDARDIAETLTGIADHNDTSAVVKSV